MPSYAPSPSMRGTVSRAGIFIFLRKRPARSGVPAAAEAHLHDALHAGACTVLDEFATAFLRREPNPPPSFGLGGSPYMNTFDARFAKALPHRRSAVDHDGDVGARRSSCFKNEPDSLFHAKRSQWRMHILPSPVCMERIGDHCGRGSCMRPRRATRRGCAPSQRYDVARHITTVPMRGRRTHASFPRQSRSTTPRATRNVSPLASARS